MVLVWASEPSPHVSYLGHQLPTVLDNKKVTTFSHTPRFARDGTNNQEKQPNFLNGWDKQGLELAGKYVDVDTNTHTTFSAPLMHGLRHSLDIVEQVEKGLWSTPAIRSNSPKKATSRSLINNDTRYGHAKDPYTEPLGPGHYWIEGGLPSLGPLPRDMPSRTTSPSRNPDTPCASFQTPARPDPFPPHNTPDSWFLGTGTSVSGNIAPWCEQTGRRVDVPDYRFAGRYSEAKKEVPYDAQYPAAEKINKSGNLTQVADTCFSKNHTRLAGTTFQSTQPRLAALPRARINDMRLSRKFEDEDSRWLGPGAYTPLISMGGAKRKSYKLFNVSQGPAGRKANAGHLGARSTSMLPRFPSKKSPPTKHHSLRHIPQSDGEASSSFASTTRNHKYGPHTWSTDSTLTRTM